MEGRFLHPYLPALPSFLPEGAAMGAGVAEQALHLLIAAGVLIQTKLNDNLRLCVAVIAEEQVCELIRCPCIAGSCSQLAERLFPPNVITAESVRVSGFKLQGTDTLKIQSLFEPQRCQLVRQEGCEGT